MKFYGGIFFTSARTLTVGGLRLGDDLSRSERDGEEGCKTGCHLDNALRAEHERVKTKPHGPVQCVCLCTSYGTGRVPAWQSFIAASMRRVSSHPTFRLGAQRSARALL